MIENKNNKGDVYDKFHNVRVYARFTEEAT